MGLEQKVFHDCDLPEIPAVADYRFTCPDCGSIWSAWQGYLGETTERYGFLGLRTRVVPSQSYARWMADHRTYEWKEVTL